MKELPKELKRTERKFYNIFKYALKRFRSGAMEHGIFNPELDYRNDEKEIKDECVDAIVYLMMFLLKIESIMKKTEKLQYKEELNKRKLMQKEKNNGIH